MKTQCAVCGSSAPITRYNRLRQTELSVCYTHEAVCWDHLSDPCDICDAA